MVQEYFKYQANVTHNPNMRSIHPGNILEQTSLSNASLITWINFSALPSAHGGNSTSPIFLPLTVVPRSKPLVLSRKEGSEYHSGVSSFTSVGEVPAHISYVCGTEKKSLSATSKRRPFKGRKSQIQPQTRRANRKSEHVLTSFK